MKRCFLYAYDKQNLGDDLFVHTIAKRYPNVQFYIWSNVENKTTFQMLPNVKVIDHDSQLVHFLHWLRPSLVSRYRAWLENRCEAVVYIGGSLFIEYESWEMLLTWWEYEAKNRPFYILGANFGPYRTEAYREKLAEIFAYNQDVCFRDRYSEEKFAQVPTVRYAPDILFGLEMPQRKCFEKRVFFSVIDCAAKDEGLNHFSKYEEDYLHYLCQMIQQAHDRGYQTVLASFCKAEGDEQAIDKILRRLPDTALQIKTVRYTGTNADVLLQEISDSDFVVASRFHGAILGFDAGKPVLPVVYSDKTIHVLEDAGFQGTVIDLRNIRNAQCDFSKILADSNAQKLNQIGTLRQQSELHFEKTDKCLKNRNKKYRSERH